MNRRLSAREALFAVATAAVVGCAATSDLPAPQPPARMANHDARAVQGPESCQGAIETQDLAAHGILDPESIGLLVWNIQKGRGAGSIEDLQQLASGADLVLIQEARLEQRPFEAPDTATFWSFAPGYTTPSASTGVLTASRVAPILHCQLSDLEPWMRSPKAISITHFALMENDATLAVVNVHAVNFTFGVKSFERQIAKVGSALSKHDGPVILAGDFNTWRARRVESLQALTRRLDLEELAFEIDDRITAFGKIVDRIFVRGLRAVGAKTSIVSTSDHNPMLVELRM